MKTPETCTFQSGSTMKTRLIMKPHFMKRRQRETPRQSKKTHLYTQYYLETQKKHEFAYAQTRVRLFVTKLMIEIVYRVFLLVFSGGFIFTLGWKSVEFRCCWWREATLEFPSFSISTYLCFLNCPTFFHSPKRTWRHNYGCAEAVRWKFPGAPEGRRTAWPSELSYTPFLHSSVAGSYDDDNYSITTAQRPQMKETGDSMSRGEADGNCWW